ncbi:MAG: hypothetical protein KBT63_04485 [Porticoccaceae bacterium]|nr:hypothetical protein [Porticoccaceae bacterium]
MILSKKSLGKFRELINEETEYRSGPQLVKLFNGLGFNEQYGQGFPSRWMYTDQKLDAINGTPQLDKCIREVFSPVNFIGRINELDVFIKDLNQYLAFDKWKVVRNEAEITFKRQDKVEIDEQPEKATENEFLNREFNEVNVRGLGLEGPVTDILQSRIKEIEKCFKANSPLAVILLAGSTLEGILLGLAIKYPKIFNVAISSPKDSSGKVKQFHEWSLAGFIDVAKELKLIQYDTHKFSHSLRDFRNYIHPFEQMSTGFSPREHTAKICLQVLKAAIYEISENIGIYRT